MFGLWRRRALLHRLHDGSTLVRKISGNFEFVGVLRKGANLGCCVKGCNPRVDCRAAA